MITDAGIDHLGLDLKLMPSIGSALLKLSFPRRVLIIRVFSGSPDASMSTVLWAKTQQLQEDAFRQLQNIYGEKIN